MVTNDNPALWWASYSVETIDGQDVYTGTAQDGSEFHLAVPAGAGCAALGIADPVAAPASVTNSQARAVLLQMPGSTAGRSLFQDVDDALKARGGAAWQAWEFANEFTRDGALVGQMGAAFGMSAAQLDALFVAAAGVSA